MPDVSWLDLATAALSGGMVVKALDIAYLEYQARKQRKWTAKRFVDENLDPLLKAGDELVGKIRSLAERDFTPLISETFTPSQASISEGYASVAYLFARFWARVDILRREGLYIELSHDQRGKRLMSFLGCLESQRVRIVDRTRQRAIGETLVQTTIGGKLDCIPFVEFVEKYERDQRFRDWVSPLVQVLARARYRADKQRLLQYGVVVHALLDTLDQEHVVTNDRPSYPNKLSKKTKRSLKYRVFGQYSPFVLNQWKYYGRA